MGVVYRRMQDKDETVIKPFHGMTIISPPGPVIRPTPDVNPGTDLIPQLGITLSSIINVAPVPSTGGLFTGRSSGPLQIQSRTPGVTSQHWFRTPALTKEVMSLMRCMRLRTLGCEITIGKADSSKVSLFLL
jgi:hypothetical protein